MHSSIFCADIVLSCGAVRRHTTALVIRSRQPITHSISLSADDKKLSWSGLICVFVVSCSGRWFSTVCVRVSAPSCTQTRWTKRGKPSSLTSSARCEMAFEHISSSSSSSLEPRYAPDHTQVSSTKLSIDNVAEI